MYFMVHDWFTRKLHLKGIERDVFAVIYGFCQMSIDKTYKMPLNHLADFVCINSYEVLKYIKKLEKKKYLHSNYLDNGDVVFILQKTVLDINEEF